MQVLLNHFLCIFLSSCPRSLLSNLLLHMSQTIPLSPSPGLLRDTGHCGEF